MVYGSLGHHVLHRAHGEFGLAGGAEEVQALQEHVRGGSPIHDFFCLAPALT